MTLRAQNQRGKTFAFCIEKWTIYASRVIPLCFSSPMSIKFELSTLLPVRKYIVLSTLPDIKKLPICTSDTLTRLSIGQYYRQLPEAL